MANIENSPKLNDAQRLIEVSKLFNICRKNGIPATAKTMGESGRYCIQILEVIEANCTVEDFNKALIIVDRLGHLESDKIDVATEDAMTKYLFRDTESTRIKRENAAKAALRRERESKSPSKQA